MKKTITLAGTALILVLAGCTTNPSNPADSSMAGMDHGATAMSSAPASGSAASHNSADTMFTQMMIVHHQQAVSMSETVLAATDIDPQVTELARSIKDAQGPEIEKMKALLRAWGEPESMPGSMSMPGMMTDAQLAELAQADGATATKLFLNQMIAHHQGAVESAKTEEATGTNPEAVQLAKNIISAQQAEIEKMQRILAGL